MGSAERLTEAAARLRDELETLRSTLAEATGLSDQDRSHADQILRRASEQIGGIAERWRTAPPVLDDEQVETVIGRLEGAAAAAVSAARDLPH